MKYRKSFVTNSSSSSFVCDICGASAITYDSLNDADACQCENGHEFCEEHILPRTSEEMLENVLRQKEQHSWYMSQYSESKLRTLTKEQLYDIIRDESLYEMPEIFCPICQFVEYKEDDLTAYLEKKYKISKESVLEEIQKKIPQKQNIYARDYITFVINKLGLYIPDILATCKHDFTSYRDFKKYIQQ